MSVFCIYSTYLESSAGCSVTAASTTGYLFRITTSGNWDTNRGYSKYNGKTDTANLATIENPSDKDNIRIKLSQKANVTVTYHDGLSKGINLIITPAVSTYDVTNRFKIES